MAVEDYRQHELPPVSLRPFLWPPQHLHPEAIHMGALPLEVACIATGETPQGLILILLFGPDHGWGGGGLTGCLFLLGDLEPGTFNPVLGPPVLPSIFFFQGFGMRYNLASIEVYASMSEMASTKVAGDCTGHCSWA